MHIVAIVINIIAIIVLSAGLFHKFEHPKHKAIFGYTVAGSMILYIAFLGLIAIYEILVNRNLYGASLILCVISPFIIGKLVKYETLKKYTVAQIICFIVSLVTLLKF